MRRGIHIHANVPAESLVSLEDLADYIQDAVESWGGQFRPPGNDEYPKGDPLFPGNPGVRVVWIRIGHKKFEANR
jgi:hypothetical protein